MFSSNQIFEISGDLSQLEDAIKFALRHSDNYNKEIFYQITKDGKYCLGWKETEDWKKFQFDFDIHIVSEIVKQHCKKWFNKEDVLWDCDDGSTSCGFIMRNIPELFSDTYKGIKEPFYGIISIESFTNFYSK